MNGNDMKTNKKSKRSDKKKLNRFLKTARKAIIDCCEQLFDEKIKVSQVIVNGENLKGFSAISDIVYTRLLVKAYNKEKLVTEKANGKHRYITFDYEKNLMTANNKLIIPGDSMATKLNLFNMFKDYEVEHKCEVCDVKSYKFCSRCHIAYYCSEEHQKLDWSTHKLSCNRQQKNPILSDYEKILEKSENIKKC